VSLTCSEHPSIHPQEDLYMQFYDISTMHPYKQSGHILLSTRDCSVHVVGSYYIAISQCAVQKTYNSTVS